MKIERFGKAKILMQEEIKQLFCQGFTNTRDITLFAICLFTACRIQEACTLHTSDVYSSKGAVHSHIIFRKNHTKGKLDTRIIPVAEELRFFLKAYFPLAGNPHLFPGRFGESPLDSDSAARILRKACKRLGIEGVSTHSFRRTALTQMSNAGIPLRVIQEISGHRNLAQLQKYLEVKDEQVKGAIASLAMLSPTLEIEDGKYVFSDFTPKTIPLSDLTF